ncbi:G-patch and DUF1604 domain containing protein [Pseudohyphozyma bogoriensis]|nr:G-patch and DUF1604 domain containing protein [Pseudohyphozyma bogoriensis]
MATKAGAAGTIEESFVTVGTPLPSLLSKKGDVGEFKPVWEQEVVDEQGRRRFHGAFTGGFSAGYFNSVGSKEGWTPSTFKSSRDSRADGRGKGTQVAEDFMDEEDLAELASSRTLSTAAKYAGPAPSAYDPLLGNFQSSSPTAPVAATAALASLIEPASTRIGAQLMRRMGWRDGQGVGPRLTFQQRKKQAAELGVKLDAEGDDEDPEASRHYFAPLDRPLVTVTEVGVGSDRGWGLGYKPGPSIASGSGTARKDAAYGGARMSGGMDDDEDDVYGVGSAAPSGGKAKNWRAFDMDDEDEGITLMGMESKPSRTTNRAAPPPKKSQSFHDGTGLLPGFVLDRDVLPGFTTSQPPPSVPRGWSPNPKKVWDENIPPAGSDPKGKGKQLDASERGAMLGEPAPPPVPKSVFDYLSARDKERLASLSGGKGGPSTSSAQDEPPEPEVALVIPPLDAPTALAALKGFQPFGPSSTSPDSARQARYTLYLQLQANILPPSSATLPFGPRKLPTGKTQTIAELNRELDDYAKSARVFKPLSGMLSGRFTSGGAGGTVPKVEPGLYQPPARDPDAGPRGPVVSLEPTLEVPVTPAQRAARAGMFGSQTRTVDAWRPAKLLCKRFGVKDPWDGAGAGRDGEGDEEVGGAWKEATRTGYGRPAESSGNGEVLGKQSMDALMQSSGFRRFQPAEEEGVPAEAQAEWTAPGASTSTGSAQGQKKETPTLANVGLGDDENQGNEILTQVKPPKDIFAAIFADSDDEDEDDEEDEEETATDAKTPKAGAPLPKDDAPPAPAPSKPAVDELAETPLTSVDLATYRPTFVSATTSKSTDASTDGLKKKKKDKSKKPKGHATLSFDVDEDGGEALAVKPKKRKRDEGEKRKEVKKVARVEEEEDEWVEKVNPVDVVPSPVSVPTVAVPAAPTGKAGRAKASDFL